ncbi:Threonine-phosphate decarboxylase [Thalassocella blandensis]|nr:Threonine-phosphate decarboxylase [Thalassocella blandensis]
MKTLITLEKQNHSKTAEYLKPSREHGGNIQNAVERWGIPHTQWLDLSTGISPFSYPLPAVPEAIWQHLPYDNKSLIQAARSYYGCDYLLPVSGSQEAIECLPRIFKQQRIALPEVGYSEHAYHWQNSDHTIVFYHDIAALQALVNQHDIDLALVINPNNPTGKRVNSETLIQIANTLKQRKGHLIVDEAFVDCQPRLSLANTIPSHDNIIVLRSMGKFFGLAGIRMGFVLAATSILASLADQQSLWHLSGPTLWAAETALKDYDWHAKQIKRLNASSNSLAIHLKKHFPNDVITPQPLFVSITLPVESAENIFNACATQGILLRFFDLRNTAAFKHSGLLRFGLPRNTKELQRLNDTLNTLQLS